MGWVRIGLDGLKRDWVWDGVGYDRVYIGLGWNDAGYGFGMAWGKVWDWADLGWDGNGSEFGFTWETGGMEWNGVRIGLWWGIGVRRNGLLG